MLIYTISLGLVSGATYMTAVSVAWQYFPGKEGVLSGTIIGGFGIGAFIFPLLSTKLINPEEIPSFNHENNPNMTNPHCKVASVKPFCPDIADNLLGAL